MTNNGGGALRTPLMCNFSASNLVVANYSHLRETLNQWIVIILIQFEYATYFIVLAIDRAGVHRTLT